MVRTQHEMDRLLQDLGNPDWEARFKAAEGLGRLKRIGAVKRLLEALKDEEEYVREAAAWARARLATKRQWSPSSGR